MNGHAHMSGQISGQVSAQASAQVSGPATQQIGNSLASQMQSLGPRTMEPDIIACRRKMQEKICKFFQRNITSDDWLRKVPEYAKRMEERLFKDPSIREIYLNLVLEPPELRLHPILKRIISQSQTSLHNVATSTSHSTTMIPTPGMSQSSSLNAILSNPVENPTITNIRSNIMPQSTTNMGNLNPTMKPSVDIRNSASFSASVPINNSFQQPTADFAFDSGGRSVMPSLSTNIPRQLPQMIPTPGFNNPQTSSLSSDISSGVNFSNTNSNMVAESQHQRKHMGSQDDHIVHSLGGQNGLAGQSNMQLKTSYGFSNGLHNGDLGLVGSNRQSSGPTASEGFLGASSSGSSLNPRQQHLDQQQLNSRIASQQALPVVGNGYPSKSSHLTGTDTYHVLGSSALPTTNGLNATNLESNSRTNSNLLNHHASFQSLQNPQNIRTQRFDQKQKLDSQMTQSATSEPTLLPQQQIHQLEQQSNQKIGNFVQNQQLQSNSQNQQFMYNNDGARQNSVTSNFSEQMVSGNVSVAQSASLSSQANHILPADFQSQHPHNTPDVNENNARLLGHVSSSQNFQATLSQGSGKGLQPDQQTDFSNSATSLSFRTQTRTSFQSQWHVQLPRNGQMLEKPSTEQLQAEFHQRIEGQEEAQQPQISIQQHFSNSVSNTLPQLSRAITEPADSVEERNYLKQRRWLLFMFHAKACSAPKGQCKEINCTKVQELLVHMRSCNDESCRYARCSGSNRLIKHFNNCKDINCPVCATVRQMVAHRIPRVHALSDAGSETETKVERDKPNIGSSSVEASDERQMTTKRMKIEEVLPAIATENETTTVFVSYDNEPTTIIEANLQEYNEDSTAFSLKLEAADVNNDQTMANSEEKLQYLGSNVDENVSSVRLQSDSSNSNFVDRRVKQETLVVKREAETLVVKGEAEDATCDDKAKVHEPPADQVTSSKSGKTNIKGVSLTELFTPEQIREHIFGLRQWVGQSKAKAEKNQAMELSMNENSCQLCAVEKLTFDPPPLYCSLCGARVKRNAMYYTIGSGDTRHYFCISCYNEVRADSIQVDGSNFSKARMEKKKNDEETEEWWVQCDKCEAWQHQICALFNGRRNDGGQAEYTCPNCYVLEVKRGERKPLPQSAVLGAKDLPRTILSDHIERRLFRRLKFERQERARHLGKNYDEVPGAEGLVVRVVSSVDKKLEVKPRFLEIFQEENYPREFPYKSKAILLFQKIQGVEVCLFGMYVQEFGSECALPNQRRVYLSYLDSVKYFRPEIKTVSGEALRTFVYHEILIGYLEYCKKRGFTSCYIWACPPLKGEDYILYCHPEIQKTPRSDKLREWYLSMLRKASNENIVVELTNLYDHFFVTMGECKARVTAARLPYFDGDYWPGAAEDMINLLRDEEDGKNKLKKGTKKTITKRALKAAGQTDLSGNASKDALLMQKLGETICPMKEDFIMVHLQHCCKHCCILMVSGTRWVCNQCKNFQLCEKCFDAEKELSERERHPIHSRDKHTFLPIEIEDVAPDTKDKDEILESEFFDTRQAFLSLCQGNHYQYDTLRRAKHSSMMVLYHLHNPTAPAFVTTCNVCQHDIETGQGWRCEVCPEFDVCNSCYSKGSIDHPHMLTNHPSMADRDAQNKEARQQRVQQLRKMLDLLVHASQCRLPQCQYPNCRKVKGLFRHGMQCKKRVSGGCVLCKKMWYLLQLHARACKESECIVPRCRDLKEHLRRMQQQSDSRRRAAVMEMMRQRAAEVAGSSG